MQKITSARQMRKEFQIIAWKQRITGGQLQVQEELSKREILEETDPLKNPINHVQKTLLIELHVACSATWQEAAKGDKPCRGFL